jgi:hypothetical protein
MQALQFWDAVVGSSGPGRRRDLTFVSAGDLNRLISKISNINRLIHVWITKINFTPRLELRESLVRKSGQ